MENKWKEICYLIDAHKTSAEGLFQNEIVNIFEKLGWSRYNKEIEEKRKIDIGSASSLMPDIILRNNTSDLFVVELKKPSAKYRERNDYQLFSYMRQLKLNVGLLINDRIHLFYEDNSCSVPVEIMNIEFVDTEQDGLNFIKLFSRESFKQENLLRYCQNQLRSLEAMDYITTEEYSNRIRNLIKNDICKEFGQDATDMALRYISINMESTIDQEESKATRTGSSEYLKESNKEVDLYYGEAEANEIEKVKRRIPRWLNKPEQTNSRILIKAMAVLCTKDDLSYDSLEKKCSEIDKFRGNFEQMANIGAKNHGKVFDRNGDTIQLWEPIGSFLKESYSAFIAKK